MRVDYQDGGIYLPDIDLWLDPAGDRASAWISHAHSDHAGGLHGEVLATEETLRLYEMRHAMDHGPRPRIRVLGWGDPIEWRGARLTAFPAAHILGAAQLLVEWEGERLVYTGDIKLRAPLCGRNTEIVPCGHLIIESTFGLPVFRFLAREAARERIVRFARECLGESITPAFLGYALGRGQEIVHVLREAGVPVAVHGAIARYLPFYAACGVPCEGWTPSDSRSFRGKALVVPPGFSASLEGRPGAFRVAYVSGWAALDNARARARAGELIPYSDHAGFDELLELVAASGARQIDVVHGYTEPFARILTRRGVSARAPQAAAARAAQEGEG